MSTTRIVLVLIVGLLCGCSTIDKKSSEARPLTTLPADIDSARQEIAMTALSLLDTGYQFGGKNPEAGVDCSGMVAFVYQNAVGLSLPHNAAAIAKIAKSIAPHELKVGDLVFFNTTGKSFSHVGIFLGEDRFIHAPSTRGKVRIENLRSGYFSARFEAARRLLD